MKLHVVADEARVECLGLELLKLTTALRARLGGAVKAEKAALVFPLSALPLVQDLIAPLEKSLEILDILRIYDLHARAREKSLTIIETQSTEGVPEDWVLRLDPAQSYAVAAMTTPNLLGLCLFDEQGSGKTVMTIAAFDILKAMNAIDAMIVVCPKTMVSEWPKDIERFLTDKYKVSIAEGNRQSKFRTALTDFDILVTNYEGIDHMQVALSATAAKKRYLLVVDESYYVKNTDSLRSESAKRLRTSCNRCFVLCGTPAPNSPYDLINQFNLADTGVTFAGFEKSSDTDTDRDRIADLLATRGTLVRRLKIEIFKYVPEKNFHIVRLPLTGRQALLYEKARAALELDLKAMDNTSFKRYLATYFQRRATLLQICSNPSVIDPTFTDVPVKYQYLDGFLADLIAQGRKVILWTFYRRGLDELAVRYAKYTPVRIDGTVNTATRRDAVELFQNDPDRMVFIGNPAAAGAGVTLHAAYDAIYVSYSNQAAHYLQSLDRIHRRGQNAKEVNYYLLVCTGTIEEMEVIRLRRKELQQHSLLGDHIPWPSSLDEVLAELSGQD